MTLPSRPPARLKRRDDFKAASRGRRVRTAAFTLQVARRRESTDGDAAGARFGFTVTKKIGNAVERNRIRRRLREAVRLADALSSDPRTDYVVVAQREVLGIAFARLRQDLEDAVRRGERPARAPHTAGAANRPRP